MSKGSDTKFYIIIAQAVVIVALLVVITIRESTRGFHGTVLGIGAAQDTDTATSKDVDTSHFPSSDGPTSPMVIALEKANSLPEDLEWKGINAHLKTITRSDDYCTRRNAMKRAAGLVAGETMDTVNSPEMVAETRQIKMGTDSGMLVFVPSKTSICKGDTVTWYVQTVGHHAKRHALFRDLLLL